MVAVEVVLVAADESERALGERRLPAGVVVREVSLDDAVEHRNQCRTLPVQRLGRLRETDSANPRECVKQLPKRWPWDCVARVRQRCIDCDRSQSPLDPAATLQNRRDLARRDAGAVAVRESQIDLGKRARRRASADVETPRSQEAEDDGERILEGDAAPQNHRRNRVGRHGCSLGLSSASPRTRPKVTYKERYATFSRRPALPERTIASQTSEAR